LVESHQLPAQLRSDLRQNATSWAAAECQHAGQQLPAVTHSVTQKRKWPVPTGH